MADPRLPQQVILDVVYFCDIPTLKCLRLAHRSIRDLIDTYQISIHSNALERYFTKEEVDLFQLLHGSHPPILALFVLEYRVKTAKWLAAVGQENYDEVRDLCHRRQYGSIGANESDGDTLRGYITIGWSILWRLADIARKAVHEITETNVSESKKFISSMTRGLHFIQKLETAIKQQQLEYIRSFPCGGHDELTGYHLMHATIASVFSDRVFDDPRGKTSNWRTGNEFGFHNSWLNWLVLREGPCFFARAWGSKKGNAECLKHIVTEWSNRSNEQILIEQAAAVEVDRNLFERYMKLPDHVDLFWELVGPWKPGREIERVFTDITFHLGRRLPADVIRSIEYSYSDYSS